MVVVVPCQVRASGRPYVVVRGIFVGWDVAETAFGRRGCADEGEGCKSSEALGPHIRVGEMDRKKIMNEV